MIAQQYMIISTRNVSFVLDLPALMLLMLKGVCNQSSKPCFYVRRIFVLTNHYLWSKDPWSFFVIIHDILGRLTSHWYLIIESMIVFANEESWLSFCYVQNSYMLSFGNVYLDIDVQISGGIGYCRWKPQVFVFRWQSFSLLPHIWSAKLYYDGFCAKLFINCHVAKTTTNMLIATNLKVVCLMLNNCKQAGCHISLSLKTC